ncbi:MAG: hypothetical protein U9N34_07220, partial [Candidatus Cloacimonadota bacterium]|nr:hypothetical protein [Candidatus Cloacimonadota bacterium]
SERLLHIEKEANRFHKNEIFLNSSLKNFYTNITFAIETITDTIQTNEINIPVIENKIDYFTKIFDKDFELHNFTKIYLDLEEYSKISEQFETHFLDISSTLSIINKLKHNNSYGFEIENRFLGMDTEQYDEYIDIVNLKFILRITDKFELNIKMNNILSQQYLWGNEINLFHYQAGIKWIFLN